MRILLFLDKESLWFILLDREAMKVALTTPFLDTSEKASQTHKLHTTALK